ncbi:hypothetical protein IFM89_004506 [Coptis chinensis]|uniref:Uncharacterized protein n=1 Tax=Coptis chinensis TaxID=261450 RepID=A0A835GVC7_9MAGN|nr:hypothetical protein IFM89_004506 [Coptis chinensis]
MGRPPCCDKDGIKKGPWTPEEDIILASYIQEHGPGNWRSVPTNTGLLRCSKSCRLRWTNYLRPGIKRGNFTAHEERMIVHLQALLGNKWASIASYLPQRTDNDIKNYWNTHLKKKIKKYQSAVEPLIPLNPSNSQFVTKRYSTDKRSKEMINQTSIFRLNQTSTYVSSTENISKMLEGWMKSSSPKARSDQEEEKQSVNNSKNEINYSNTMINNNKDNDEYRISSQCNHVEKAAQEHGLISHEEFESLLMQNMGNVAWVKSESANQESQTIATSEKFQVMPDNDEQTLEDHPTFAFLKNWLLEESTEQVEPMMELSSIF